MKLPDRPIGPQVQVGSTRSRTPESRTPVTWTPGSWTLGTARGLLLGAALLLPVVLPVASAQVTSPAPAATAAAVSAAQRLFDRVNLLLQREYGGLSTVDRPGLQREYQARLDAVCAATLARCPESKAYPVIEAELTALGDEHSFFETPEDYEDFLASATGGNRLQFGVKLARLDGQNRVITEVVPGSAADEAGLRRGDLLLTLNDRPYQYDALRSAREKGEAIRLGVSRLGQPLTVNLTARESSTRELPRLSFVAATAGAQAKEAATGATGEVAVLRIPTFLAGGGVAQAVHDLVGEAQLRRAQGMIVDLRGNGGGSLAECDSSVSAFVPTVTRIARSADGQSRTLVSRGTRLEDGRLAGSVQNPNLWAGPLVVLVDQDSASCSEFFAYEVQYAGRGPVIGEVTAGVGNTATRVFQAGEGALQLTILNYAKPDGRPYPERITPDQVREQGEEAVRQLTQGKDTLLSDGVQALLTAPTLTLDPFRQRP